MDEAEDVQLVEAGEDVEEDIDDEEDDAVRPRQTPAVAVRRDDEEYDGAQQRQRRVGEACVDRGGRVNSRRQGWRTLM